MLIRLCDVIDMSCPTACTKPEQSYRKAWKSMLVRQGSMYMHLDKKHCLSYTKASPEVSTIKGRSNSPELQSTCFPVVCSNNIQATGCI